MKAVFKQSIPLKIRFLEGFLVSLPGIPSLPLFWEKGWKGAENLCPYLVSLPVVFEGRATTQVFLRKTFLVSLPVVFVRTQTKNVKLVSFQKKKAFWNKKCKPCIFSKKKNHFLFVSWPSLQKGFFLSTIFWKDTNFVSWPSLQKGFFFVSHFLKRYTFSPLFWEKGWKGIDRQFFYDSAASIRNIIEKIVPKIPENASNI